MFLLERSPKQIDATTISRDEEIVFFIRWPWLAEPMSVLAQNCTGSKPRVSRLTNVHTHVLLLAGHLMPDRCDGRPLSCQSRCTRKAQARSAGDNWIFAD
jgi:hypothetical protein